MLLCECVSVNTLINKKVIVLPWLLNAISSTIAASFTRIFSEKSYFNTIKQGQEW